MRVAGFRLTWPYSFVFVQRVTCTAFIISPLIHRMGGPSTPTDIDARLCARRVEQRRKRRQAGRASKVVTESAPPIGR